MKFIAEDIQLQLQPETNSAAYEHIIRSEVICNGKRTINSSEKIVNVTILKEDNKSLKIQIKTNENSISLDNLLKKQEKITLRIASLTDNVLLGIDKNGFIANVHNHNVIEQKWEALKQELKQLYEGNELDRYIYGVEKKIKDESKLLIDFQQPRLFGLLFNGLYTSYRASRRPLASRTKTVHNILDHIPIVIDEDIFCDNIEESEITIRLKGTLNKEKTYLNKIENHLTEKGVDIKTDFKLSTYNSVLKFNTDTGLINNGSLIIETNFGERYKRIDQLEMNIISA